MIRGSRHSDRLQSASSLTAQEHAHNRKTLKWLAFVLVIAAAFIVGFVLRSHLPLMSALGFNIGGPIAQTDSQLPSKNLYNSLSARVGEVEDLLASNSLDTYSLNPTTEAVLQEFLEQTGDPYATYFNAERYEQLLSSTTDGDYGGIGVLFADYQGRAYAADVFSGSEAQAEGVEQGDYVIAINGDDSHTWTMTEVIHRLSQANGQEVVITWMRAESREATTGEEFTTTLTCRKYEADNVTSELQENVGVIKVKQLTQSASTLASDAIEDLTAQGAQAFVLDVRGNSGGYLAQAVDIASLFLDGGVVVQVRTLEGTTTKNAVGTVATAAPLVVLADEYTAAAAEVLVAALVDNDRATFVGTKTMGKGSVQVMRELSFGGALRYTAAYYLTPLGTEINGNGITPSVNVAQTGDEENDTQLVVAVDTARSLIRE